MGSRRSAAAIITVLAIAMVAGVPGPLEARPRFAPVIEDAVPAGEPLIIRGSTRPGVPLADVEASGDLFDEPTAIFDVPLPFRANLVSLSFEGDPWDYTDPDHTHGEDASDAEPARHASHAEHDSGDVHLPLTLSMRAHRPNTGWGDWEALRIDAEEGPDGDEGASAVQRVFTEPHWLGTAGRLVIAARGEIPPDLRVHLINSRGDATSWGWVPRAVRTLASILTATPAPADAAPSQPIIITRSGWGADESWRNRDPRYASRLHMAFVHHTAGSNSYSPSDSAAIVRSIYRFHTHTRGWSDIGYNFLVDRYGQIFEGRYGGMTEPVIGAHVFGYNVGSAGIALMGHFQNNNPTTSMIAALQDLLAWKLDVHHVPPYGDGIPDGEVEMHSDTVGDRTFKRISGHRDGQATACPGSRTYQLLPQIREAVHAMGRPKIYLPSLSADTVLHDETGIISDPVRIRSRYSDEVSWRVQITREGHVETGQAGGQGDGGGGPHGADEESDHSVTGPPSGPLVREWSGTQPASRWNDVWWDGSDGSGQPVPTGIYRWRITATAAGGAAARPATGLIPVLNPFDRLAGEDRIETAIEISRAGFPTGGAADAVVIARADDFPDALAGTPFAAAREAPLLLTSSDRLDARTEEEIKRALPMTRPVYLLGGERALARDIALRLIALGYPVERIAGANRFETAVEIAERTGSPGAVFLATGAGFPDALAAGAAARARGGVVVLTNDARLPAATSEYLKERPLVPRYTVGGPAAAAYPGGTALAGSNRYETAVRVAEEIFSSPARVGIASGAAFPDALAGGAHIAGRPGPLLLTRPDRLPDVTAGYLQARRGSIHGGFLYGGTQAVAPRALTAAQRAIS